MKDQPSVFAVTGAKVYDGLGSRPVYADVVVEHERIRAVAPAGTLNLTGVARIDGTGCSLAPGFIDPHSHSDLVVLKNRKAHSRITQGFTTEIIGNCGDSAYLVSEEEHAARLARKDIPLLGLDEYAAELEREKPASNILALVGHGTLRNLVMGFKDAHASNSELARMREILGKALAAGAAGFSSGLWYIPGKYSATEEVAKLASMLRGTGKPYATHMRDEGDTLLEAFDEAAKIAAAGSGILQISHMKTMYRRNWHKMDSFLEAVDRAQRNGLRITADRYPFVHTGTSLRMVVPPPYDQIPNPELMKLLQDPAEQDRLDEAFTRSGLPGEGWNSVLYVKPSSKAPQFRPFLGLDMVQIGEKLGMTPSRACILILSKTCADAQDDAAFAVLSRENLRKVLAKPYVMAGSDGAAYPFDLSCGRGNPRDFSTCPEFFGIVKELASPEEAVRRMTSLPCSVFNIPERGIIREGFFADLVLFDEETFRTRSTFAAPHTPCSGMKRVFVAGHEVFRGEEPEDIACAGRFIRIR